MTNGLLYQLFLESIVLYEQETLTFRFQVIEPDSVGVVYWE